MRLVAVTINGILDLKNFYPLALELKTKHSINVDILGYRPDIANLTNLYDGLIVGSDWNQNAALVQAFNAAGRKTILLQSEGMFFRESQWYVGKAPIAKAACLWGPIHKDIFLKRGYTGALAVVGPPRFDIYWKFRPAMSKRMIYKKLGMPDLDRPYVVYLCQFFPRHEFGGALYQNQIDLTQSAARIEDIGYAVIKTHPQESKDYFSRSEVLGGSLPDHVRILDTGGHTEAIEISTLMYHSAGVVTFSSTAAIEAMMMGRPAAVYSNGLDSPLANGAIASLPAYSTPDELAALFKAGVSKDSYESFAARFLPGDLNGQYTARAAKFIALVVRKPSKKPVPKPA